jgi:hypothetical protein
MYDITKYQIPSLGLIFIGIYVGLDRLVRYVQHLLNPPSHQIGLAAEIVTIGFLFVAVVLISVGKSGFRHKRPVLPLTVLIGVSIFWGTFMVNLYTISTNTQFVTAIRLSVSIIPAVAIYLFCRYTRYWTG